MSNIKSQRHFTAVTRRTGRLAHIEMSQSRNNPAMMFLSSPPVCELTEGQALDLLNALEAMVNKLWPITSE